MGPENIPNYVQKCVGARALWPVLKYDGQLKTLAWILHDMCHALQKELVIKGIAASLLQADSCSSSLLNSLRAKS
eukprot:CAMPEP_0202117446 /NCGR_PEP_ID=MMETSP0965-20130614/42649_1 /ASSEMBLY_ACC=CAM_ASM_000507 /TAXON_ID=4773 /ORGANISM="Schizochytrium aggregatum, Strain ATCC28209" /LENGTH=74 /DNA_ID=CAMNT_0048687363 /DNA_START=968 /DNA_END=1192 /DNA_ORIENTATION=-